MILTEWFAFGAFDVRRDVDRLVLLGRWEPLIAPVRADQPLTRILDARRIGCFSLRVLFSESDHADIRQRLILAFSRPAHLSGVLDGFSRNDLQIHEGQLRSDTGVESNR